MHLSDVAWTDAAGADTDLALLPVGSTEQHGPHAPLGTDAITATAVAEEAETRREGDVVVAPTIPVGVAEEHRDFAGTLWVREDTFRAYVREVVESLASHGFDRVVAVNGHGGNVAALREVCARVTRDGTAYAVPFTWFDAVDPDVGMGHGGPVETSLVRAVAPDLVREDRVEEARQGAAETWGEWVAGTNLAYDSAEFTESGVVGDPGEGSAELGDELLAGAADALVDLLDAVAERERDR
jgi:creatinine amidohydrolase